MLAGMMTPAVLKTRLLPRSKFMVGATGGAISPEKYSKGVGLRTCWQRARGQRSSEVDENGASIQLKVSALLASGCRKPGSSW